MSKIKELILFASLYMFCNTSLQSQVTVSYGETSQNNTPIAAGFNYSYSQVIYLASEINASGMITSISYYVPFGADLSNSNNWTIYMGHTPKNEFTSNTDWEVIGNLTQVFTGSVSVANTKITVNLDIPFNYNGTSNLIVALDENQSGANSSSHNLLSCDVFGITNFYDRTIAYFNNSTDPNPATPPTANLYYNMIPKTTFGGITESCPTPTDLGYYDISPSSAQLYWTQLGAASQWKVEYGPKYFSLGTGTLINNVNTNPFTLNSLNPGATYDYYVQADCGAGTSNWRGPFTFKTLCTTYTVPFQEGFNSTSTSENCWRIYNENLDIRKFSTNTTVSPYEGNECVSFTNNGLIGNNNDFLVSPKITLSNNNQIRYAHRAAYSPTSLSYQVLLSTTGNKSSDFTNVLATLTPTNSTFQEVTIDISGFSGDVFIAFRINNGILSNHTLYLDDFNVEENIPACFQPSGLSATNTTTSSATLSWIENGTATNWNIEWGLQNFVPGNGNTITGVSSNTFNLNPLSSGTYYDFYVQADCGANGPSTWKGPFTFFTPCTAFSAPFQEGFNMASVTEKCWTVIDNNSDNNKWNTNSAVNTYEGDNVAVINTAFSAGSNDDYLITPQFNLTSNERLTFYYASETTGELNDVAVYLSSTGKNPADFNVLLSTITASNSAYQQASINLSAYSGNVYLAFKIGQTGNSQSSIFIDDVRLEQICTFPTITNTSNANRCGAGTLTLQATASNGTINWYDSPTNGNLIFTGNNFSTGTLTNSTTYYVEANDGNCSSSRTPVNATIYSIPTFTLITNGELCNQGTATITAQASEGVVNWFESLVSSTSINTGTILTTPILTTTTTYYIEANNGNCSSNRNTVTVNVYQTPTITATFSNSICGSGTMTLSANSNSGSIDWYTQATGGTLIYSGNTYTTPNISNSTTFYVEASSGICNSDRVEINALVNALPNNNITQNNNILTANQIGGIYQWIDCDNSNSPILGQTSQTYTATLSGNYAVSVSNGTCEATSNCVNVIITGLESIYYTNTLSIYPNPNFSQETTISSNNLFTKIELIDITGKTILTVNNINTNYHKLNTSDFPNGIYLVKIYSDNQTMIRKLIIEK